jgi:hypothetical protein
MEVRDMAKKNRNEVAEVKIYADGARGGYTAELLIFNRYEHGYEHITETYNERTLPELLRALLTLNYLETF